MTEKQHRGFAAMDPEEQKAIARKGGVAAHAKGTAHEWSSEKAREAGRKGAIERNRRWKMKKLGLDPHIPFKPLEGQDGDR